MYYANKIEIHIKNMIGIQPCIHSHKMLHKKKKMLHEGCYPMHHGTKICMCKKKPMEIMNVYGLLVLA
jgi:hypothetical protein